MILYFLILLNGFLKLKLLFFVRTVVVDGHLFTELSIDVFERPALRLPNVSK